MTTASRPNGGVPSLPAVSSALISRAARHIPPRWAPSTTGTALNVDSSIYNLRGNNSFWQAGSTATITGQTLVWASPKYPNSAPVAPSFIYSDSSNADRQTRTDVAISSPNVSIAQDATTEVGTNTALGFLFVSTDENVGAIYYIRGTTQTVAEVSDPDGLFTVTAGTASSYNIYWDGGSSRYVIQNKRTARAR